MPEIRRTMTEAALAARRANAKAIAEKRRAQETCRRGHNNWRVRKDRGTRYCLTCHLDRSWYTRRGLEWPDA